jgi:glycerol uptake facilitator-like aquaporin
MAVAPDLTRATHCVLLFHLQAVLMEIFGTALLTYVVFGVAVDKHATRTVSHMAPLAIGFTVFICHMMLVCHARDLPNARA